MKTDLTPYQQSLVNSAQPLSWKRTIVSWTSTTVVALCAIGFWMTYANTLPDYLHGVLVFIAVLYVGINCAANILLTINLIPLLLCKIALKITDKENTEEKWVHIEVASDEDKASTELRSNVVSFIRDVSPFLTHRWWSLHGVVDFVADWTLFTMMLVANYPVLAFFHGSSLLVQYWLYRLNQKFVLKIIKTLPDPLETDEEVDMDDLMDKLCNPDDPNDSTAPKE